MGRWGFRYVWRAVDTRSNHDLGRTRPLHKRLNPDARKRIEEEVQYETAARFSEVVLWHNLRNKLPVYFKVSPLAVIPQVGRRGRLLLALDLSFPVQAARPASKLGRRQWLPPPPLAPSANSTTAKLSPDYPIKEIGRVLPRLLVFMVVVPAEETIMFAKIDLSDGFWRMLVRYIDKSNFAYVLPGNTSQPTQLVIPHALQMGWTESPGYFCADTETGRNILQALIDAEVPLPSHQFDVFMTPAAPTRRQTSARPTRPWQMSAVYVDDYKLAAVESPRWHHSRPRGARRTPHHTWPIPPTSSVGPHRG